MILKDLTHMFNIIGSTFLKLTKLVKGERPFSVGSTKSTKIA